MGQEKAIVNFTFFVHPLTTLGFTHEVCKPIFQHTCTNAAEHIVAGLPFQDHSFNALEVQQL